MSQHPDILPLMQVQQVSLAASIGSSYLLEDISFNLDAGECLAIVGASGAGKTSLLRLLNRLNEPTQGKIFFEGQNLNQINVHQLRRQVVLVMQEPKLLNMTVQESLAYPLKLQGLAKAEINSRIAHWLANFNIPEDWLERNELQLSLGQRQLITIVRALVMQPKILILDEPTSALDIGRASRLIQLLKELAKNSSLGIIMVNHQLDLAQHFCHRLLHLQGGKMKQDLRASEINWSQLREEIVQTESQIKEEWKID